MYWDKIVLGLNNKKGKIKFAIISEMHNIIAEENIYRRIKKNYN